jgi:hypothetical protein
MPLGAPNKGHPSSGRMPGTTLQGAIEAEREAVPIARKHGGYSYEAISLRRGSCAHFVGVTSIVWQAEKRPQPQATALSLIMRILVKSCVTFSSPKI